MSVMKWDTDSLRNDVVPQIKSCYDNVEGAISTLSSVTIPEGFPYPGTISAVRNSLNSGHSNIFKIILWVVNKAMSLDDVERKNENILSYLAKLFGENDQYFSKDINYQYEKENYAGISCRTAVPEGHEGEDLPVIFCIPGQGGDYGDETSGVLGAINNDELEKLNAYVVVLSSGVGSGERMQELVEAFCEEHNVDKNNMCLVGYSLGAAQATTILGELPDGYFKRAAIVSAGGGNGENLQKLNETEVKIYVGENAGADAAHGFSNKMAKKYDIAIENVDAGHGKIREVLIKTDEDGDGKSDFLKWMMYGDNEVPTSNNEWTNKLESDMFSSISLASAIPDDSIKSVTLGNNLNGIIQKGTPEALLAACYDTFAMYKAEGWKWRGLGTSGGLIYEGDGTNTFENVRNNPKKATCCATGVADALNRAGYITEHDVSINGQFNPNYQHNVERALKNKGWELITDIKELKAGDVLFYPAKGTTAGNRNPGHVNVYAGDGKFYDAGSDQSLAVSQPFAKYGENWEMSLNSIGWWAYRPPNNATGEELVPVKTQEENQDTVKVNLLNNVVKDNSVKIEPIELTETKPSLKTDTIQNKKDYLQEKLDSIVLDKIDRENNIEQKVENDNKTEVELEEERPNINDKVQTTLKPNNPNSGSGNRVPHTKPSTPEKVEILIEKCTPEAIIEAAKNVKETTSDSNYICEVLNSSGYLSEKGLEEFKDYSIKELCGKFEGFGWERITDSANLQVGDIIVINSGEGETARIYAGDNKWYIAGSTEVQQEDANWSEGVTWYAYRPSEGESGITITL